MRTQYILNDEAPARDKSGAFKVFAAIAVAVGLSMARTAPIEASRAPAPQKPEVPVYSRGSGTISEFLVSDGSEVSKGQVIARMDSTEIDHEIETVELRVQLLADEITAGLQAAARGKFEKAADRQQLALKKRILESDLKFLKQRRDAMEIHAPSAGRVMSRVKDQVVGQRTEPGDVLFHIQAL